MQRIKNYFSGISPRVRFLIVYFMVMGFGVTTFTRLAETINAIAFLPTQIVMAYLVWRSDGSRRDVPMLFGCVILAWGFVAAAINGKILDQGIALSFMGIACAWFFMLRTPQSLSPEAIKDEFCAICTVYLICYLPLLLIALASLFSGIAMFIPGDNGYPVGIVATGNLTERFRVMDNANDCARIEMMCILLAIYLFINRKQIGWRIFSVITGLANLMVLSHTQSRTGTIALSLAIGVLAFRAMYVRLSRKGLRIVVGALACALAFFVVLNGVQLLRKADIAIAKRTAVTVDESTIDAASYTEKLGQFDVNSSGRPAMWRRIGEYMLSHPKALLTGVTGGNVMDVVDEGTGITYDMRNTHNSLIDCATSSGVPFMLIILAFLIYMIPRCWRVLTGNCGHAEYIFVAIIVGMLVDSVSEIGLFATLKGENSLFMLACGYVLYACRWDKAQLSEGRR